MQAGNEVLCLSRLARIWVVLMAVELEGMMATFLVLAGAGVVRATREGPRRNQAI